MTETLGIGAILGFVIPPIVSFLKSQDWPDYLKVALSLIVSLVMGTITSAIEGNITLEGDVLQKPEQLLAAAATAFTVSTVIYKSFFAGSLIDNRLTDS